MPTPDDWEEFEVLSSWVMQILFDQEISIPGTLLHIENRNKIITP